MILSGPRTGKFWEPLVWRQTGRRDSKQCFSIRLVGTVNYLSKKVEYNTTKI
jgi:hypothetical protein